MQDVSFEKFSEGLKSIFQNNLDNGLSEVDALEGVVDNLTEKLSVMDISKELVNECSEFIIQDYKEGLANGQTPVEAFNSAMESLNLNLEKEILNSFPKMESFYLSVEIMNEIISVNFKYLLEILTGVFKVN